MTDIHGRNRRKENNGCEDKMCTVLMFYISCKYNVHVNGWLYFATIMIDLTLADSVGK